MKLQEIIFIHARVMEAKIFLVRDMPEEALAHCEYIETCLSESNSWTSRLIQLNKEIKFRLDYCLEIYRNHLARNADYIDVKNQAIEAFCDLQKFINETQIVINVEATPNYFG